MIKLPKISVNSRQVSNLVKAAITSDEWEVAALMAVARHFLLRVPSEGIPLQWDGSHSNVALEPIRASITLYKRKNSRAPVTLTRECCCAAAGERLCAMRWFHSLRRSSEGSGHVYSVSKHYFARKIKDLARYLGMEGHARLGTHAFRRGMAQDIIDGGGSLGVLMMAGGGSSSAYTAYLRGAQFDDVAVAGALINLSDSEDE